MQLSGAQRCGRSSGALLLPVDAVVSAEAYETTTADEHRVRWSGRL